MIARSMRMTNTSRSSIKRLVSYLMDTQGHQERVLSWNITNCLDGVRQDGEEFDEDDVRLAAVAMQFTQKRNTRARGDKTYHLVVSFREKPDASLLRRIEEELCSSLGFGENERVSVLHGDTDNIHLHIAINKIHPKTHRMISPFRDHTILANACRRLEKELSVAADNHEFRTEGRESPADRMEFFSDMESMSGWIKRNLSPALLKASSWEEFHAILAEHGLHLRLSGNGCAFTDGKVFVKGSTVSRAFSKGSLEKRFGPFRSTECPDGNGKRYERKPMPRRHDSSALWQEYQAWRDEQKRRQVLEMKELDAELRQEIHETFETDLSDITARYFVADRNMRRIIRMLRAKNREHEIRSLKARYRKKKSEVRHSCALMPWRRWLELQAMDGRADALALIRSRGHVPTSESLGLRDADAGSPVVKVTRRGTRIFENGLREYLGRWTSRDDSVLKAFMRKNISHELILNGSEMFRDRIFRMLRQCGVTPRLGQPEIDAEWRRQQHQAWSPATRTVNRSR